MSRWFLIVAALAVALVPLATAKDGEEGTTVVESRAGPLEFTHDFEGGYPTQATVDKVFDEMDYQRACQAYIWALPIVQMAKWQDAHRTVFGVKNGQIVLYESFVDKLGILTSNSTTVYLLSIVDLAESGPYVFEEPAGSTGGMFLDFWQRLLTDTGVLGPFYGKGGKYLLLPPGAEVPEGSERYHVIRSPTNNILVGWRLLGTDPDENQRIKDTINGYPYAQKDAPPAPTLVSPDGRTWDQVHPRGLAYWKQLADILTAEVVGERDRFFMAMLKPLGIERGKPFTPDARQKRLLEEGAKVGEAMAKANTFRKRFEGVEYRPGSTWHSILIAELDQRMPSYDQIDERASYFYEACTVSRAMQGRFEGAGQAYLGAYQDGDKEWLDGGRSYKLNIPANPPAKRFWSVTVYDVSSRCMINNDLQRPDRSSRSGDLLTNADGSVDIYFGPTAPKGKETNWIPTNAGKNWFAYMRFYGPLKPFIDRTWPLPDIEKTN